MKKLIPMLVVLLAAVAFAYGADERPGSYVSQLSLDGEIEGENITFTLQMEVDIQKRGTTLPLVAGDVAYLEGELPKKSELLRDGNTYSLKFNRAGKRSILFRFASRPIKEGDWRRTRFEIPAAGIRQLSVLCDRGDLELRFPGALDVKRETTPGGMLLATAFLGVAGQFEVGWKPEVRKLDAELVVTCDANTVATASVGALRLDTILTYRVIQGRLEALTLGLPNVNVTQVRGDNIQDWRIDRTDPGKPRLVVILSRPSEDSYRLQVESELVLAEFPCDFELPVFAPRNAIRSSGFVMIGTDSAIKMQIRKAAGVTQVDQESFPRVSFMEGAQRALPGRGLYAYQYASTPYTIELTADDIVTSFTADDRIVLELAENELALSAAFDIDIKDAPAREMTIEVTDAAEWVVTSVNGRHVVEADVDIREEDGRRLIVVPFANAVSATVLINVRMERPIQKDTPSFTVPRFKAVGAKSERGYFVAAAEQGVRLNPEGVEGIREVHIDSAPMRVNGAQHAFRFREPGWTLAMSIQRAAAAVHSEVFHLVSIGEGVAYHSVAITYHIGGSPVQEFVLTVPEDIQAVEFTGADIEGWTRDAGNCTVRLQERVTGDYTLLVTYDRQFDDEGADIDIGKVTTHGAASEVGYIAVASSLSLDVSEAKPLPLSSVIQVERGEVPSAYAAPVTDPILRAYKILRAPHEVTVHLAPYDTEQLLGQIVDFMSLSTRVSKAGESVTTASYYIKNASRQFLVVKLPESAELWSIRQTDGNGHKENVLSQESDKGILIPISRPLDPNTPIEIEVTYAEKRRPLGLWHTGLRSLRFVAPGLVQTHGTFATWTVHVPKDFAVGKAGGNMQLPAGLCRRALTSTVRTFTRLWLAILDGPRGLRVTGVLTEDWGAGRPVEFKRAMGLSGADSLSLKLWIVPAWVGRGGSVKAMTLALTLGVVAACATLLRRSGAAACAFSLTLLTAGLAQAGVGRAILAVLLALLAVLLASMLTGRLLGRLGRRKPKRRPTSPPPLRSASQATPPAGPPPMEPDIPAHDGTAGHASPALLAGMCVLLTAAVALAGKAEDLPPPPAPPLMDAVVMSVDAPAMRMDIEPSADLTVTLEFSLEEPTSFIVIPPSGVLKEFTTETDDIEILATGDGYRLNVLRKGEYTVGLKYQLPLTEKDATWTLDLFIPDNMRNALTLALPETELDITSIHAVLLKTEEHGSITVADVVFGPSREVTLSWRPRARTTRLEKALFFCEVNTMAILQSGVIDLVNIHRFQVAQGEIREIKAVIPKGMSVTAVRAPGLATWSFDPTSGLLEAILEKPVTGDFVLVVNTQLSREGLPYTAVLGIPQVQGAARQRGSLSLGTPDSILVRTDDVVGLSPMNIEDFSRDAVEAASALAGARREGLAVRRAYRYHVANDVSVTVETERVLPEIRVVENGTVTVSDERIKLATKVDLAVVRSGIFAVKLALPADFEVETLTGPDVSHWDEIKPEGDDAAEETADRLVEVHFTRRVTDKTDLNLVAARMERGLGESVVVPRVRVLEARKHTGKFTISSERGVRMMVDSHAGVDVKKASDEGIRQQGVLVFDILRPTWTLTLHTEVMEPLVKPEVLQWVDLTEGMLQYRTYFRYKIENAGVKTFRLKAPYPGVNLSISGRSIARVHEVDSEQGIWQVDLRSKAQNMFSMVANYQVPYNATDRQVKVQPLRSLDTEDQRGYLVVTCGGRVQVTPTDIPPGLKVEDARNIPSAFGAGDLSNAIQCYRTLRPDYVLPLSVVRHGSADVLPASIEQMHMTSVLSQNKRLLTRVKLQITVGDLRFLQLQLPNPHDELWTVLVNGKETLAARDAERYRIPLEQEGESLTAVELIYAGTDSGRRLGRRQKYVAPRFLGLPLNNIEWMFYVDTGLKYHGFEGTLTLEEEVMSSTSVFSSGNYLQWNDAQREANLQLARQELTRGTKLARAGQQKEALKAFQQAQNYSQAQEDLNEDARVQFRNLVKKQVKMGLVNRRDAVRHSQNIIDEDQPGQMEEFQGGQFTQDYVENIERRLTAKDNAALEIVADKMIDQQTAAAGVVTAIRITMPEDGRPLQFARALQIDPDGELFVSFKVGSGWASSHIGAALIALALFSAFWFTISRMHRRSA